MEYRVITITSQTTAIKARRLLSDNRIQTRIIKLHPSQTPRGCTYGLKIKSEDVREATSLLYNNGIPYSDVIRL